MFEIGRVYNRRSTNLMEVNDKVVFRRLGIGLSNSCSPGRAESSTVSEMGGTTTASSSIRERVRTETWISCVGTEPSATMP